MITPDSRAQGRSSDSEEPLSYQLMVDDMIILMDSLGIDSAYVGGASDGAAIAIHMAIHYDPLLKEWADAGIFFLFTGALFSHIASGHPWYELIPATILLILTILSWYFRPEERKLLRSKA